MRKLFFSKTCTTIIVLLLALLAQVAWPIPSHAYQKLGLPTFPVLGQPKNLPALEKLQIIMEYVRKEEIEAKRKAGEPVHFGSIEVTSEPEGAGVLVSSYVPLGKTPFKKDEILTGLQRVTVRKEGYYGQVRMVEVTNGGLAKEHFKLEPIPYARLTIEGTAFNMKARVIGVAQDYTPGMKLEPGEYLLELTYPFNTKHRFCVVARPDQNIKLEVDLRAERGGIELEPVQDGVTVYLDGQEVFGDKLDLKDLIPGPHKLQVWKSLYKPFTKTVVVQPGKVHTVFMDLEPAEHFTNKLGMTFVKIPAGKFMMGFRDSPEEEALKNEPNPERAQHAKDTAFIWYKKEYPRHLVEISKPFFMQTTEVTLHQYKRLMRTIPKLQGKPYTRPVQLRMAQVEEFLKRLNKASEGKVRYRLPTEAEWEYACRAGTTGPFYTGETISPNQAHYSHQKTPYGNGQKGEKYGDRRGPYEVARFSPNPWGLYDMHGNVDEVCSDWLDYFFPTYSPVVDPFNPGRGDGVYVLRGGDWETSTDRLPSAKRSMYSPKEEHGLRLVAERLAPPR